MTEETTNDRFAWLLSWAAGRTTGQNISREYKILLELATQPAERKRAGLKPGCLRGHKHVVLGGSQRLMHSNYIYGLADN